MNKKELLYFCGVGLLVLLAYLPTLQHELIWDAKPLILENDLLVKPFRPLAPFGSGYWASTSQSIGAGDYYRPLTILSLMIDRVLLGLGPTAMRLGNLLIFLAGLLVVFLLLRRLSPGDTFGPRTTLILFALFPLHLDNVTWVAARGDLLMFFFAFLALLLADRHAENSRPVSGLLVVPFFTLALLAKEAAVFFLPLFFLLPRPWNHRRVILTAALAATAILHILLKAAVTGSSGGSFAWFPGLGENLLKPLGALGYYLRSLVYPLSYDMFLAVDDLLAWIYPAAGLLFALSLLGLLLFLRRFPVHLFFWALPAVFIGAHLTMIFTPIYPYAVSTRYLLVPALGWCWLLSLAAARLPGLLRRVLPAALVLLFLTSIPANGRRYDSETRFWQESLAGAPHDPFFMSRYADQLRLAGDADGARALLHRALERPMRRNTALSIALQLAEISFQQSRFQESLAWLARLDGLQPGPAHLAWRDQLRQRLESLGFKANDLTRTAEEEP